MKQPSRRNRPSGERPPLDRAEIEALALGYAGRYLTTRSKLHAYLRRKIRERGGPDDVALVLEAVVARAAASGFVDDRAFADARAAAHARRGLGAGRLRLTLRQAGVQPADSAAAVAAAEEGAWEAAVAFARRRRLGPYGAAGDDLKARRRAFAAMLRAGHSAALAGRVLSVDLDAPED